MNCKRLGNKSSKAERISAHKSTMLLAKKARSIQTRSPYVRANLSKHHPEDGETPAEQSARMLEKNNS